MDGGYLARGDSNEMLGRVKAAAISGLGLRLSLFCHMAVFVESLLYWG